MIKPWDYINEYKKIKSKIIKSIDSSLSSGFLILGPQLDLFEKKPISLDPWDPMGSLAG